MALLKQKDIAISGEEARQNGIVEAMVSGLPEIPTFKPIRDFTPLVVVALQRAANPYVIGRPGFEALGIAFDAKGKQVTPPAQFGIAMMPKTAEVVVLLTCDNEQLKAYAVDPVSLESAALDVVNDSTLEAMAGATVFIANKLKAISAVRTVQDPKNRKPEKGGAKKKPARTGLRKS